MMTDHRADEELTLLGHPSAIETIAADYPAYQIHRDRDGAHHGDWVAAREGVELRAEKPTALLVRLESQELSRLQDAFGHRYAIRRTPSMWIATLKRDDGTEPTIIRDTSAELEEAMEDPGRWGQRAPLQRRPR